MRNTMGLKNRLLSVGIIGCVLAGVLFVSLSGMQVRQRTEDSSLSFHKKETIYFWYTDTAMADYIGSAAVSFGEKENVRVIPVLASGSEYLEAINEASMNGKQIPDAYIISNDTLEKAYLAGLASKISDETQLCTTKNFPQTALDAVSYKGNSIAYPYYYETSALLYNKTYLEEWAAAIVAATGEGTNVEVFVDEEGQEYMEEMPLQITQEQIAAGIPADMDGLLAFADNYDAAENVESILKWDVSDVFFNYQFVGKYMIVGGDTGEDKENINIYNEETKKCLEVYQALNQFFFIDADKVTYDSVLQEFIEGKVVFTLVSPSALDILAKAKESGEFPYEYGIARIPQPSTELEGRSMSVTNAVVINGYSENKDLANRFATYLTGEYLEKLYARTGKVSAKLDANTQNPYLMTFMEEYKNSISLPKMIETSNFWIHAEIAFSKIWNGADIDSQLNQLSAQILSQVE